MDPLSGWRFPLAARATPGTPLIIGRNSAVDGSLPDRIMLPSGAKTISRRHAEICFGLPRPQSQPGLVETSDARFHLRSFQGGKNAVFHNGIKLQAGTKDGNGWVALENGDRIIVGPVLLHFRLCDSDDSGTLDSNAPSRDAVEAAIRALTAAERKVFLNRRPSLRQYAVDETMAAWLDSSAVAAVAGGSEAHDHGSENKSDATLNLDDRGQLSVLDESDNW